MSNRRPPSTLGDHDWASKRLRPWHLRRYGPGRCRVCGLTLSGRRTAYCSDACSWAWAGFCMAGHHWLKVHTGIRDGFRCQDCGFSCLVPWWVDVRRKREDDHGWHQWGPGYERPRCGVIGAYFVGTVPDLSLLELHHIVPVEHGGEDVDENLVMLCPECHLKRHGSVSAAARRRMAPALPALEATS